MDLDFHGSLVTEGLLGLTAWSGGTLPEWLDEAPEAASAAIEEVGDRTGELWLHLLGLGLDAGDAQAPEAFIERFQRLPPVELLRRVVGVNVPAWRDRVAIDTLEAAANGDAAAALALLTAEGYYGGQAARALPAVLQMGPQRAHRTIVAAITTWFEEVVLPRRAHLEQLHAKVDRRRLPDEPALDTVERIVGGLRLEPEPYTQRVALVPQFVQHGWLTLTQDESTRIVTYDPTAALPADPSSLARVFAALGEVTRLEILQHLARSPGGVSDVARETGLAKSTAHQHLSVLREAGLIRLAGQAWRYRYEVRPDRLRHATERMMEYLIEEDAG